MQRQRTRSLLLFVSFLLFPITQFYFSPYIIIAGAFEGVVTGSCIVFTLLLFSGIFAGRLFCGWLAPCGGLQELCCHINNKRAKGGRLNWIKYAIWIPWLLIIISGVTSYGGYHTVNPFFYIDNGISLSHPFAYIIYYGVIILIVSLSLGFGRRATCHYLCWMAPFMIIGLKIRKLLHLPGLHISIQKEKCISCSQCTKVCPMSLDVKTMIHTQQFDHAECILCGKCIDICKSKALSYKFSSFKEGNKKTNQKHIKKDTPL